MMPTNKGSMPNNISPRVNFGLIFVYKLPLQAAARFPRLSRSVSCGRQPRQITPLISAHFAHTELGSGLSIALITAICTGVTVCQGRNSSASANTVQPYNPVQQRLQGRISEGGDFFRPETRWRKCRLFKTTAHSNPQESEAKKILPVPWQTVTPVLNQNYEGNGQRAPPPPRGCRSQDTEQEKAARSPWKRRGQRAPPGRAPRRRAAACMSA